MLFLVVVGRLTQLQVVDESPLRPRRAPAHPLDRAGRRPRLDARPPRHRPRPLAAPPDDLRRSSADRRPAGGDRRRWRRCSGCRPSLTPPRRRPASSSTSPGRWPTSRPRPSPTSTCPASATRTSRPGSAPATTCPAASWAASTSTTTAGPVSSCSTTACSPATPARWSSKGTRTAARSPAAATSVPPPARRRPRPHHRPLDAVRRRARLAAQIDRMGAKGGTVIVSVPGTGEILAMANLHGRPRTAASSPTGNNLALTTVFEPGSVNKVITLAAALEEGVVTPDVGAHGARPPPGVRPPVHRPRPAPHRAVVADRHPHRRRRTSARSCWPRAGPGPHRLVPAPVRLRRADRARLPERVARHCCCDGGLVGHLDRLDPDRPGHRRHRHADAGRLQRDRQRRRLRRAPARARHHRRRRRPPPTPPGEPRRVVSEATTAEQCAT